MRKMLALTLAVLLLTACFAFALAEGLIDFSGYALEELLDIRAALLQEIASRPGGAKMELGAGQYLIGEALPAGMYTFKFVQNGDSEQSSTSYFVYENESMFQYDLSRLWVGDLPREKGYLEGDGETLISLHSGECLAMLYNGAEIARIGDVSEREDDFSAPAGTAIPVGQYTIGVEIPAGMYNVYFGGISSSRVRIFQDSDEAGERYNKGKQTIILNWDNTEGTITLYEGNVLRVEYTPIVMTKSEGFTFD